MNQVPFSLKHCPICGKLPAPLWRPFCSERCKQLDLHRWLTDVYTIPVKDNMQTSQDILEDPETGNLLDSESEGF